MTSSAEDPTITLGDVTYPVPPVAFREVSKILPMVDAVFAGISAGDISENVLEGLGKIIYLGIKRGSPDLTYDQFLDRPATAAEMIAAATTVCGQAGLKKKEAAPGEAKGETILPQTSMS